VARALIARTGRPVAAPSANRSTGISPTLARHVLKDLDGRIDLILDSGPTTLGLESTVVDLSRAAPRLLRPGPLTRDFLAGILGKALAGPESGDPEGPALSPGQMAIHYAPRTPTVRIDPALLPSFPWPARSALIVFGRHWSREGMGASLTFDLPSPETAAARLYATLHQCDESDLELIVIVPPPPLPQWSAILDRLGRASVPFDS
jgi:L-threonylcarbamoyladenylate synthase